MTVIPEEKEDYDIMVEAFNWGQDESNTNRGMDYLKTSQMRIEQEVKKNPLQKRAFFNRLSQRINMAPELLTFSDVSDHKTKNPKHIASGLGYGGVAFAKGFFDGITGVVYEPYKGGKKDGFKGTMKGFGRGLLGVVAKPAAGTVGLVGCTVEGTINTPYTIKRRMTETK